ncbi:MAG: hypothetical protein ACK2UL_09825 [Anaerolineae bacterium]|jgi:hypothetical protein
MTHHTTHEELQALVGRALIDPTFKRDLLNGHRAECLDEFNLTRDERVAASMIQASDLRTFARQLDRWITDRPVRGGMASSLASTRQASVLSAVA